MKASYIVGYGGPGVIRYGEIPDPVMTPSKVLVRVRAVSVNPIDNMIRMGKLRLVPGTGPPRVLGFDFSGIIEHTGSQVKDFQPGERVYGVINPFFGRPGALSEVIALSPKGIRRMPDGMTFEDGAAVQIAGLTAWNGLRKAGDLHGKSLLVNGGSGGVGHLAIQIGRAKGAVVTAVCSAKNMDFTRQMGASEVIDYQRSELDTSPKKYDIIFDAFAKMAPGLVYRLLNERGIYISTLFLPPGMIRSVYARLTMGKRLTGANMRDKPEDYDEIERLYLEDKIRPFIHAIYFPEESREAFELVEHGGGKGKTIIRWPSQQAGKL